MPDDARQHREGDVVERADADAGYDEVEEDEHAGADLGDAIQFTREMGGRGRADTDDGAGQAGGAHVASGGHGGRPLPFREGGQRLRPVRVVAFPGVGEHAAQSRATVPQDATDGGDGSIIGLQAAAMPVRVDLDQRRDRVAGGARGGDDGLRLLHRVEQHREVGAGRAQFDHPGQLRRRDADGVGDVAHAGGGEDLRLPERRHGRRPDAVAQHAPGDVDRFDGLEVGPERDTQGRHPGAEAGDVARHARLVQQEGRRPHLVQDFGRAGYGGTVGHVGYAHDGWPPRARTPPRNDVRAPVLSPRVPWRRVALGDGAAPAPTFGVSR